MERGETMKQKVLTIQDLARMGAAARNAKLSAEQRSEAARRAVQARWRKARQPAAQVEQPARRLRAKVTRRYERPTYSIEEE